MKIRSADAGMDTTAGSWLQRLGGYLDIFENGAGQSAYRSVFQEFGNFVHRLKVAGRGDRESRFEDIYPQRLQLEGQFDLFLFVEFTTRYLLAVAKGGIKYEDFLIHIKL